MSTSVVHWSQAVITLLTCCVPDLKLHSGVIQTDSLSEEGSYRKHDNEYQWNDTVTFPLKDVCVFRLEMCLCLTSDCTLLEFMKLAFDKAQH